MVYPLHRGHCGEAPREYGYLWYAGGEEWGRPRGTPLLGGVAFFVEFYLFCGCTLGAGYNGKPRPV